MILSHYQTRQLTEKNTPSQHALSVDLGRSTVTVEKTAQGWQMPDGQVLSFSQVSSITKDQNSCFQFIDGQLKKVEAFSDFSQRYYSLMPTSAAPTLLISGIPMHRIKETTPLEDTREKIRALGKPQGMVLDTAAGLGYTAMEAARSADRVITVEYDPAVLKICRLNPWSQGLFTSPNISPVIGDSADLVHVFQGSIFNAIIHDPPMFSLAGHLYSQAFYYDLFRILKPRGRLFHYIGNPDSRIGAGVGRGVVERLQKAGFSVKPKKSAFGVLATK